MADSLNNRRHVSKRTLIILVLILTLSLLVVVITAYSLAKISENRHQENRDLSLSPHPTPFINQMRRAVLKRHLETGDQYLEILADGTVNLYDANMRLLKSGLQGFGRLTNLFKNFEEILADSDNQFSCPQGYEITLYTNIGTYTCTIGGNINPITDDLIDEFEDIVEDTFAPTLTPAPTASPAPTSASLSPTPTVSIPIPSVTDPSWNPLTPTPLPQYMTDPPFSCSDYNLDHPFTISNVICGAD